MVTFWTAVASELASVEQVAYLRVELWADSGRVLCFAINCNGRARAGNRTFQAIVPKMAEEWLQLEGLSDALFDAAIDELNSRYAGLLESARNLSECALRTRYFDADSEDEIHLW
jgi:hypothetical protein